MPFHIHAKMRSWSPSSGAFALAFCAACASSTGTTKPTAPTAAAPPACPLQLTVFVRPKGETATTLEPIRRLARTKLAEMLAPYALDADDIGDTATACIFDGEETKTGLVLSLPSHPVALSPDAKPDAEASWAVDLLPDRLLVYQRDLSPGEREALTKLAILPPRPGRIAQVDIEGALLSRVLDSPGADKADVLKGLRTNAIVRIPTLTAYAKQLRTAQKRLSEVSRATITLDCEPSDLTVELEILPRPKTALAAFAAANANRDDALIGQTMDRANIAAFSNVDVAPLKLETTQEALALMPWSTKERRMVEKFTSSVTANRSQFAIITIGEDRGKASARLVFASPHPEDLLRDTVQLEQLVWRRRLAVRLEQRRRMGREQSSLLPDLSRRVPLGLLVKTEEDASLLDAALDRETTDARVYGDLAIQRTATNGEWQFTVISDSSIPVRVRGYAAGTNLVLDAAAPLETTATNSRGSHAAAVKDALELSRGPWFGAFSMLNQHTSTLRVLLPSRPVFSSLSLENPITAVVFGALEAALGAGTISADDDSRMSVVAWSSPSSITFQGRFRSKELPELIQVLASVAEGSHEE